MRSSQPNIDQMTSPIEIIGALQKQLVDSRMTALATKRVLKAKHAVEIREYEAELARGNTIIDNYEKDLCLMEEKYKSSTEENEQLKKMVGRLSETNEKATATIRDLESTLQRVRDDRAKMEQKCQSLSQHCRQLLQQVRKYKVSAYSQYRPVSVPALKSVDPRSPIDRSSLPDRSSSTQSSGSVLQGSPSPMPSADRSSSTQTSSSVLQGSPSPIPPPVIPVGLLSANNIFNSASINNNNNIVIPTPVRCASASSSSSSSSSGIGAVSSASAVTGGSSRSSSTVRP